jgi:hypothetical protein
MIVIHVHMMSCQLIFDCFLSFILDFFAASADHLLTLVVGIGPVIHSLNNADPQITSRWFCKVRGYIFQLSLMLSRWFIAFACIDRYASSCDTVHRRNFARPKVAYRTIALIIIIWSIICSHRLIYFEIDNNVCGISTNPPAAIYHSIYIIIGSGLLPVTVMITCALLIRRNLSNKQNKSRQNIVSKGKRNTYIDQQILRLLFIQIISYIVFTMPQLCNTLFSSVSTINSNRSSEYLVVENFIRFIAELMLYMFPVSTFYLYSLTSRTFRNELMRYVHRIHWRSIQCWTVRLQPTTMHSTVVHPTGNSQAVIDRHTATVCQIHVRHAIGDLRNTEL